MPQFFTKNGEDLSRLAPAAGNSFSGTASIGGPFVLIDQHGRTVTEASLKGHYTLVSFGYSSCPDICPTTLNLLTSVIKRLGPLGDQITPVFITIDPHRDTVAVLADYASHFHPRLIALTGSEVQTHQAAAAYKVYAQSYQKNDEDHDYAVDHSAYIYLMGPDGTYLTHFPYTISEADMAAQLTALIQPHPEKEDPS